MTAWKRVFQLLACAFFLVWNDVHAAPRTWGYVPVRSVTVGEDIPVHIAGPAGAATVRVYHEQDRPREVMHQLFTDLPPSNLPEHPAQTGFQFPPSGVIRTDASWLPGIYRITFEGAAEDDLSSATMIVVRPQKPRGTRPFAAVLPMLSLHAHSNAGAAGIRHYQDYPDPPTFQHLHRPVNIGYYERFIAPIVRWAWQEGIAIDYYAEEDFAAEPTLLDHYQAALLLPGTQYATRGFFEAIVRHRNRKKNLLNFGAHTLSNQVRMNEDATGFVTYRAPEDDSDAGDDNRDLALPYRHPALGRSEFGLWGILWQDGNYNETAKGMMVTNASLWVFDGTGLENGMMLGENILGIEWDSPTSKDFWGLSPLTITPVKSILGEASEAWTVLRQYDNNLDAETGFVFSAGSMIWGLGLQDGFWRADPRVAPVTRNVLARMGRLETWWKQPAINLRADDTACISWPVASSNLAGLRAEVVASRIGDSASAIPEFDLLPVLSEASTAREQTWCVQLPEYRPACVQIRLRAEPSEKQHSPENFPEDGLLSPPVMLFPVSQQAERIFWAAHLGPSQVEPGDPLAFEVHSNTSQPVLGRFTAQPQQTLFVADEGGIFTRLAPPQDQFLKPEFAGRNIAPHLSWPLLTVADPSRGEIMTPPTVEERKEALARLAQHASTEVTSHTTKPTINGAGFLGTTLNADTASGQHNFLEIAAAVTSGVGGDIRRVVAFLGEQPLFDLRDEADVELGLEAGDNLWYRRISLADRKLAPGRFLLTLRAYDAAGNTSELWPGVVVGAVPEEERIFEYPPVDEASRLLIEQVSEGVSLQHERKVSPLPFLILGLAGGMLLLAVRKPPRCGDKTATRAGETADEHG